MTQPALTKTCLTCEKPLKGRSDKKFCDDFCRNTFNNQLKAADNSYFREINNILRRNRRVLESLLPAGEKTIRVSREQMLQKGFHFTYSTHQVLSAKGYRYLFCYDYGYLPVEEGWVQIVRRKEHQP